MKRIIRMGMVGGSLDGFIGHAHRMAANLDGEIKLVSGAFSSDAERSRQTGAALHLSAERVYSSFVSMIETEALLPENERPDFISIVTPNHLHFDPAKLALSNGFHVLCEKPLAFSLPQAEELEELAKQKQLLFGLTHNYTGYPMVKEARAIIASGKLGKIRKVWAEYPQGWLSAGIETQGQKQASWRTNPNLAGISCCVADIGTHAENLAEYVTGLEITELSADVSTFVVGRLLDDDAHILVRFNNGAKGAIMVSQVSTGEENELKLRVYGEKGGLEWLQSDPNTLILKYGDRPKEILRTGNGYLSEHAKAHCRLPGGHPEGYLESLANLYRNFAYAVAAVNEGLTPNPLHDFPTVGQGVRGMKFIEAVIASGIKNGQWIKL